MRKLLIAVIAAQLVIVPAQAATEPKPVHCTKAFIAVDDVIMILILSALLLASSFRNFVKDEKIKELEQQQKQKETHDCKI